MKYLSLDEYDALLNHKEALTVAKKEDSELMKKLELTDEQLKMLFEYDKTKSITIAVNLAKSLVKSYMLEELKEID